MFDLDGFEAGPIEDGILPLDGPLFGGPVFEPLAEPVVHVLRSTDAPLGSASGQVGRDVPMDLDAAYQGSAGIAEANHANQVSTGASSSAGVLVDAGAGVETYRAQALPHLPPPSTAVSSDLVPAPRPPSSLVGIPEPPDTRDVSENR